MLLAKARTRVSDIYITNPSELNVCFLLQCSSFCHRLVGERGNSSPRDRLLEEDIFGSELEAKRINCWLWLVTGKDTEVLQQLRLLCLTQLPWAFVSPLLWLEPRYERSSISPCLFPCL